VPLHSTVEVRALRSDAPAAAPVPRRVKPFLTRDPAALAHARAQVGAEGRSAVPAPGLVTDEAVSAGPQTITAVLSGFDGLSNSDNAALTGGSRFLPPDSVLGVGPIHVFQMVNVVGRITNKSGTGASSFRLASFFGVDPGFDETDPRVAYDAVSQRWFAVYLQFSDSLGSSSIILAVSTGSDPTGSFCRYRIGNPTTETFIQDFPKLGFSDDKVIVTYNAFTFAETFLGAGYYVLKKADLTACAGSVATNRVAPNGSRSTIFPAEAGTSTAAAFLAMHDPFTSSLLRVITVTGVPGVSMVAESDAPLSIRPWSVPPSAAQAGSAQLLDTGDDRVLSAAWRNGSLWVSGNEGCAGVSCLRLIEVLTGGPSVRQDMTYGTPGEYFYYPAAQPDASGNLHVVFTRSSSSAFAGVRATGRLATDPLNTLQASVDLKVGGGSQQHASGRMGDYSGAALDPNAPLDVWVIGEHIASSGPANWGTFVARLGFAPSPPTLTVVKAGTGTGRVISSPPGIDCGPTCVATFPNDTVVSLSATPDLESAFGGFAGSCTGGGPCTVTLPANADLSVTVSFVHVLSLVANQALFHIGETLALDLQLTNPGPARLVDVYFGALLPPAAGGGCPAHDPVMFLTSGFTASVLTCLSAPVSSFPTLFRTTFPTAPTTLVVPSFFRFVWPATAPAGGYTFFLAVTVPDALVDGRLDPGDLFVLATRTVTLAP
jgi:hypothetical protein